MANLNLVIEVYRGIAREPIDNVEATSQPVPPPLPSSPLAPPTPFSNLEQAQSPQDKDPIDALDTLVKSFEKVWLTHRNAAEEVKFRTSPSIFCNVRFHSRQQSFDALTYFPVRLPLVEWVSKLSLDGYMTFRLVEVSELVYSARAAMMDAPLVLETASKKS